MEKLLSSPCSLTRFWHGERKVSIYLPSHFTMHSLRWSSLVLFGNEMNRGTVYSHLTQNAHTLFTEPLSGVDKAHNHALLAEVVNNHLGRKKIGPVDPLNKPGQFSHADCRQDLLQSIWHWAEDSSSQIIRCTTSCAFWRHDKLAIHFNWPGMVTGQLPDSLYVNVET